MLSTDSLIVTIDGPGGAGKSTVARRLAQSLGYTYLDTGAMYRGIAFAYREKTPDQLDDFLAHLELEFVLDKITRVFFEGREITEEIRTPEISLLASSFSQDRKIRSYLTAKQQEVGQSGRIVVEGRDTGSVVFPKARFKFYLDADINERAQRRFLELAVKGPADDIEKVKQEIEKRDRDDSQREIAPLVKPHDAIYVDTTGKTIDEVVDILEKEVRQKQL
jgi:cytidylate kinase